MAVDPSQMGQQNPAGFQLPGGGGQNEPSPRVFQTPDGQWWEYDPRRPEGQRFAPATVSGQQIGGAKPSTDKAPQLIHDRAGNVIGYWDPDKPQQPIYFDANQQGSQVPTPLGGGYVYNPASGQVESLPPQQTPQNPTLHNAGSTVLQQQPDGSVRPVYIDQAAIARQQAEIDDARNRTQIAAQQAANQAMQGNVSAFNGWWNNYLQAAQGDETAQQNAFTRDRTLLYDLPRQQVADENQARLNQYQAAANQGTYETGRFNAGRGAAQDRVMAMMQTLPYRASPAFAQQFAQRRAQESSGQPLTPYSADAFTFQAPNFNAERQAGYAEAGVTGGLPDFESLLRRTPAFATMDPEELRRIQAHLNLAYVPPPSLTGALVGG